MVLVADRGGWALRAFAYLSCNHVCSVEYTEKKKSLL